MASNIRYPISRILGKKNSFYDNIAPFYDSLKSKNKYYHSNLKYLYKFLIPHESSVIEIGCGTGDLIASLKCPIKAGLDNSQLMLDLAKKKYPEIKFYLLSAENIKLKQKYDYVILSDILGILDDVQKVFIEIDKITHEDSRIIINYHNYLWEPLLSIVSRIGMKSPQPAQNWLANEDVINMLYLAGYEPVKTGRELLIPVFIPLLSKLINKYLARLPFIRNLCFVNYIVAKKIPSGQNIKDYKVSIILPARNEEGNIQKAMSDIPELGIETELIFVEDHSKDNTKQVIAQMYQKYKSKRKIKCFYQTNQFGKAAAVRRGMKHASGDIVIVFDSDLTVDPKELPKFYNALKCKKADFIQGSRLVYAMEKEAMRFLNVFGNKFFSTSFSFLLDQRIKDTLCGTKAMFRSDYNKIIKERSYFGNNDPFGDFDMIFGSAKRNLKMLEIPIRYKARTYGKSNINRLKHGWLLLRMTILAARKLKFF